jgi:hypothetical protein
MINIVYKLNNQINLGSVNLPDFAAVVDSLHQVLYEKQPSIAQYFRDHRGLQSNLRPSIGHSRGFIVVAEGTAVDCRIESHAD